MLSEKIVNKFLYELSRYYNELLFIDRGNGFISKMDIRFRIALCLILLLIIILMKNPLISLFIFSMVIILAKISELSLKRYILRILPITLFSFIIYLPISIYERNFYILLEFSLRILSSISVVTYFLLTINPLKLLHFNSGIIFLNEFLKIIYFTLIYSRLFSRELTRILLAGMVRNIDDGYLTLWKSLSSIVSKFYIRLNHRSEKISLAIKARTLK